MPPLHGSRGKARLLILVGLAVLLALIALVAARPAPTAARSAQDATPTPTRTPNPRATIWTPAPQHYTLRVGAKVRITDLDFRSPGFGPMAVAADGSLFVGDANQTVVVLSPDLVEQRRFVATQPYALAMTGDDQLLIGQRYAARIDLYSRAGQELRLFWREGQQAQLETLTIAPDESVYVVWQRLNPPGMTFLTHLDPAGSVLFTRELGRPRATSDTVHGIAIEPGGQIDITLSGYDFSDPFRMAYLVFTPLGDPIMRRSPLVFMREPFAPAPLVRLANGELVMFTTEFITWWDAKDQFRAQIYSNDMRGGVPPPEVARRSAVAARPDDRSVFAAEVRETGELEIAIIELIDLFAPTATPTPEPTITATPTP